MHVDQRNVTAISLRDGRERDCVLFHDGSGYRLSLVSKDDVVNIFLSPGDLQKLRQEVAGRNGCKIGHELQQFHESTNGWSVHEPCMKETYAGARASDSGAFAWTHADWLSYN